jgi:hypothetical protein
MNHRTQISPYTIDVPGRETIPGRWHPSPSPKTKHRSKRPLQTGNFALMMAGLAALCGMGLGIEMGISQDFTLAPAHAHLNLLGWVTLALYGLYHRSVGRKGGWLGWSQVGAGAVGALLMAGGLGLYLGTGDHAYVPLVVVGSLVTVLGMVLFLVIVLIDALSPNSATGA